MKHRKKCKHCGQWLQDHKNPTQNPEKLDEILEGYQLSLFECLQAQGFETQESPLSDTD